LVEVFGKVLDYLILDGGKLVAQGGELGVAGRIREMDNRVSAADILR